MAKSVAMKGSMKVDMSIQELERQGDRGSVYVVNIAPKKYRGDVLFSVPKRNGNGADICKVVKTWIPQDLTEQVSKTQLMEATEFRRSLTKGLIRLVTAEYAERVLSQDDAQQELERINNLKAAAQNILRAGQMTDNEEDEEEERDSPTLKRRKANLKKNEEERQGVTFGDNSFDVLLTSLQGKSATEIVNALRNEGGLSRGELKKVQKKYGELPKVARFVEKKLEALS